MKSAGNQLAALVQQLVIGVLAVATDAAPDHRPAAGGDRRAVLAHALAIGFHVQLLQVVGDVAQVVVVGQDRVAACAPEVAVPDTQQAEQHRDVALEGRVAEMQVHVVGAGQQFLEIGDADRHGNRQADRRPQRIAPADPVPHRQDVFLADTELGGGGNVAGNGNEVSVQLRFAAALGQIPGARGLGILQGFQGGEGFAGNDEQGGFGTTAC